MLADDIKDLIQESYRQLLKSRELTPRYGQRLMIAEIAKQLAVIDGARVPTQDQPTSQASVSGPVSQGQSIESSPD